MDIPIFTSDADPSCDASEGSPSPRARGCGSRARGEPPTAAVPSPGQGTVSTAYDANARPVSVAEPGGVSVSSSYDSMGRLTGQAGAGAEAATAARSFGYDLAGNMTSASAPGGSNTFGFNDRGLLLSASGPSGSSSFSYNGDGQVASASDAAGTTSYTYDGAGRLATLADPLTGTTATYSYTPQSQVSQISYGAGNDTRTFGYNGLHQLVSDALAGPSGQAVASVGYGYDLNGNLTSKTTAGFAGSASNTYGYDEANRLTSWTSGTATTNYGYDGAGNRTRAGLVTYAYDARDQLSSDSSGNTYAYTARGTLAQVAGPGGTVAYTSDAFGQPVTQGGQGYAYDALGRVVTASGTSGSSFSYSGAGNVIASDGAWKYSWDPSGTQLAGAGPAGGGAGSVVFTDAHTDVTGTVAPGGAGLSGSAAYDPFGQVTASAGLAGRLGYQSGWTDAPSGLVHMGARWYSPGTGQFTTRDTTQVNPVPDPAAANPFAYAGNDPMTGTDPSGHVPVASSMGGAPGRPPPPPRPAASSCGAWCFVTSAYHYVVNHGLNAWHRAGRVISSVVQTSQRVLAMLRAAAARARVALWRAAGHVVRNVRTAVSDVASWGVHAAVVTAAVVISAGSRLGRAVTRWAAPRFRTTIHILRVAAHHAAEVGRGFGAALASVPRGAIAQLQHNIHDIAKVGAGAVNGITSIFTASAANVAAWYAQAAGGLACGSYTPGCDPNQGAGLAARFQQIGAHPVPIGDPHSIAYKAGYYGWPLLFPPASAEDAPAIIADSTLPRVATQEGANLLERLAASCVGGESFTAGTKVLLAGGGAGAGSEAKGGPKGAGTR